MRFLVDEQLPDIVCDALGSIFRGGQHTFDHVRTIDLGGTKDDPLFAYAAAHGYDVLITEDRRHLREHLDALRSASIHWVGLKQKQLKGTAQFTYQVSTITGAMHHVLDAIAESEGRQLLIAAKGTGHERNQRIELLEGHRLERFARG